MPSNIWIVGAARTPIGRYGGSFATVHPAELGAVAARAAMARGHVDPSWIDETFVGHARQAGSGPNPARQVGRRAGLAGYRAGDDHQQGVCVGDGGRRLRWTSDSAGRSRCRAHRRHRVDEPDAVPDRCGRRAMGPPDGPLSAGRRDVSRRLHLFALRHGDGRDRGTAGARVQHHAARSRTRSRSGEPGEGGTRYRRGRVRGRNRACRSPSTEGRRRDADRRRAPARDDTRGSCQARSRSSSSMASPASSRQARRRASPTAAPRCPRERRGGRTARPTPMARVLGWASAGVDPRRMGIGPVPAVQKLLAQLSLRLHDFDLVELNEAFAPQVLAVLRDLPIPSERLNVHGGAIALGHPIGCTGTRILVTLLHALRRHRLRRGLATLCVSGGMGMAMAMEIPQSAVRTDVRAGMSTLAVRRSRARRFASSCDQPSSRRDERSDSGRRFGT